MSSPIEELEYLIDALKSLPGLGKKTATKWAYFLLDQSDEYIKTFVTRIYNAHKNIKQCINCFNLTKNEVCNICQDINRNHNQICIVSSVEDLNRIEDSKNYHGLYFVLNGEINVRYPDNVLASFKYLKTYLINNPNINELIIATNFTVNGQFTAKKIVELIKDYNIKVYRIGFGLPLNSALDYADDETIKYAFLNKNIIKG